MAMGVGVLQGHGRAISSASDELYYSDGVGYVTASANSPPCSDYESAVSASTPNSGILSNPDLIRHSNFTFRSSHLFSSTGRGAEYLRSADCESPSSQDGPTYDIFVHNLTYKVVEKKRSLASGYRARKEEKILLNNVTAQAKHAELLAVVGPSGSSKTTFLDALAGRIRWGSLEGLMLVNGAPMDESFLKVSQYVMQDDALFPTLTTFETLMFSARVRLPATVPLSEKLRRVETIMRQLKLNPCSSTYVGNEEIHGVSGGERRRISIGVELIHDPAVIFLDEPTSGLDSTSAFQLMQILSSLAEERKRTIVLTIHQPSYRILGLIHQILVLARGHVVYNGPYAEMPTYFSRLQLSDDPARPMPQHINVVEYAIDKVRECQDDPKRFNHMLSWFQKENGAIHQNEPLRRRALNSKTAMPSTTAKHKFANSLPAETLRILERTSKIVFRTKDLLTSQIIIKVSGAIMLGSIFMHVQGDLSGATKREGFFSFTLAVFIFSSNMAIPLLLNERQIFERETSRGAYRKLSYALAHSVVFLPLYFFLSLLFAAISYFMVGLVPSITAFFVFVLVLFLAIAAANSMVSAVAAFAPDFLVGNVVAAAIFSYFLLFSGYFLPRKSIPAYWLWMHYMSIFKYAYEALLNNEFGRLQGKVWEEHAGTTSEDILQASSAGSVHLWNNVAILAAFLVAYRALSFLLLSAHASRQARR